MTKTLKVYSVSALKPLVFDKPCVNIILSNPKNNNIDQFQVSPLSFFLSRLNRPSDISFLTEKREREKKTIVSWKQFGNDWLTFKGGGGERTPLTLHQRISQCNAHGKLKHDVFGL